jgi:hypothetical protein
MFFYTNIQFQDKEKLCCSEFTAGRLKIFVRNFWNALCAGKHNYEKETRCIPTDFQLFLSNRFS